MSDGTAPKCAKCGHEKREHFNGTGPCDALERDCGLDCHAPAPALAPSERCDAMSRSGRPCGGSLGHAGDHWTALRDVLAPAPAPSGVLDEEHDDECFVTLRAEVERLREAIPELLRHVGLMRGHDHFDRTGQSGRGCPKCISNRSIVTEAEEIAIRALKGTP